MPSVDCGVCGAPTCSVLAEDIARGFATIEDCLFTQKENIEDYYSKVKDIWGDKEQTSKE